MRFSEGQYLTIPTVFVQLISLRNLAGKVDMYL